MRHVLIFGLSAANVAGIYQHYLPPSGCILLDTFLKKKQLFEVQWMDCSIFIFILSG